MNAPTTLIRGAAALGLLKKSAATAADVAAIEAALTHLSEDDAADARREDELHAPAVAEKVAGKSSGPSAVELHDLRVRRAARGHDRGDLQDALVRARAAHEAAIEEEAGAALVAEAREVAAEYGRLSDEWTAAAIAFYVIGAKLIAASHRYLALAEAVSKRGLPVPPTSGKRIETILKSAETAAAAELPGATFQVPARRLEVAIPGVAE